MKAVEIVREIVGLFIDDGSLAIALLIWVALVAAIPLIGADAAWGAPLLFVGCLLILVENVRRTARRGRLR